jgi:hypothetical protein
MDPIWGEVLFACAVLLVILIVIVSLSRRRIPTKRNYDFRGPRTGKTRQELTAFLDERERQGKNRAVTPGSDTDCNAACMDLFEIDGGNSDGSVGNFNPDGYTCESQWCKAMPGINELCFPCSLSTPENCEEQQLANLIASGCAAIDSVDCRDSCTYMLGQQSDQGNGGVWNQFCSLNSTSYCASRQDAKENDSVNAGGYCCQDSNFPSMNFCFNNIAMTEQINSNCQGTLNDPETANCVSACQSTSLLNGGVAADPNWDPKGVQQASSGACLADYCYDTYSSPGGECYICNVSDRILCSPQDLLAAVKIQCDPLV